MRKRLNLSFAFVFSALPLAKSVFRFQCAVNRHHVVFVKSANYLHVFGCGGTRSLVRFPQPDQYSGSSRLHFSVTFSKSNGEMKALPLHCKPLDLHVAQMTT